jgi:2-furoyl-CoA dehydrogenase large subunit
MPPITVAHRETPSPLTPLGAKGLGEGNTMSVGAAVANAVSDALGVEATELPLSPSRVWELICQAQAAREGGHAERAGRGELHSPRVEVGA